jgi:hypothetical protein
MMWTRKKEAENTNFSEQISSNKAPPPLHIHMSKKIL